MRETRRHGSIAALGVLLVTAYALIPQAGRADFSSGFAGGVLTITFTASTGVNNVTIAQAAGVIQVNGVDVLGNPAPSACTGIVITAPVTTSLNGANVIDCSAVTVANGWNNADPPECVAPLAQGLFGGDDVFLGTAFDDSIIGGTNNDSLYGRGGNDVLSGHNGSDSLDGGAGDDVVSGNAGLDTFTYLAGDGADTINGDLGTGTAGNDTINMQAPDPGVTVTIDGNNPTIAPGDVIVYDARGFAVTDTGGGSGTGQIKDQAGLVGIVNYVSIEGVTINNTPAPVVGLSPTPMYVNAPSLTSGTNSLTISNTGSSTLDISSMTILGQSIPGSFSIVGGDWATTRSLAVGATTVTQILFNNTLGPNDSPATAVLGLVSNTGGFPGTLTTLEILGYSADEFEWDGSAASWDDAANWIQDGIPAREDTAIIASGVVQRGRILTLDAQSTNRSESLTSLSLRGGELFLAGNYNFNVATKSTALFVQEGGFLYTTGSIQVANGAGADGTYVMNGGQIFANGLSDIGANGGKGRFDLNDGAILTKSNWRLANGANSAGLMNINGGSITVGLSGLSSLNLAASKNSTATVIMTDGVASANFFIGSDAKGTWTQTGGSMISPTSVTIGNGATGDGEYVMSGAGSTLSAGLSVIVGNNGKGVMTVNGGAASMAELFVASGATTGTGVLNVNGGAINVSDGLAVGRSGAGVMNMTNGAVTALGSASLGTLAGGNGTASISGGSLSAASLAVGRASTGALSLSGNPTVALTGDMTFGGDGVANGGTGTFSMLGGSLSCAKIAAFGSNPVSSWSWTGGMIAFSTASLPLAMLNDGGTLVVGGAGIGTTEFTQNTTYTQTAGALAIGIQNNGVADQMLLTGAMANFNGGTIDVTLTGADPALGGSWDIVLATGDGSVQVVSGLTVNLPGPAPTWTVTSDSQRITVRFAKPAELSAPASVTIPDITLSQGETTSTKSFEIGNIGDFPLQVTSMTLSGAAGFTLLDPVAFPVALSAYNTAGSTAPVTIEFASTSEGLHVSTLVILNDGVSSAVAVELRARVTQDIISASGVDAWRQY